MNMYMTKLHTMRWTAALATIATVITLAPREAEACGGTFCDAGPTAMPVDQTGENILFVMGDGYTEAHIQIQYDPTTEANQFAWVVPMTALPEFSVGSQPLFDAVLSGTVPAYGFTSVSDDCGFDESGDDGFGDTSGGGSTDPTGSDSDTGDGPEIVLQQTVGAFDITVLSGGTAAEVMEWLGTNGYQQDPNAEPILAEYLAENYVFAAFKLTNGAETAEIHPVTLTFEVEEACVPIRLTRIAAVEDMDIRTFFLADGRVVPQTYKHVVVNPLKLDWPSNASNYKDVITMAVDSFGAEGKAFVTEYAGTSGVVSRSGLHSELWNPGGFVDLPPVEVTNVLEAQGLRFCDEFNGCAWTHALIPGLLASYLPAPDGVDPVEFYDCLDCYEALIDLEAWGDGTGFAMALQQRIVAPGVHANEILDQYPTLTRMYTTISPGEMTADPFFWQNSSLPDVDNTQSLAQRRTHCNNDNLWTLPDGRQVYVPSGSGWPAFAEEMPWEEEVAEMPSNGAPMTLVDNKALIDTHLAAYNCSVGWPASACGPSGGETGPSTATDTGGGGIDSLTGATAGDDSSSEGGASGGLDGEGRGCGCRATPSSTPPLFLFALALLGLRRRR
jgi:MYXO-CTERM domain-containing protein